MPANVIRAARRRLVELEEHGVTGEPQRDLFAAAASDEFSASHHEEHPALRRLRELEPDSLSPKEALDLLYELRQQLDQ